ncbi:hypothetical protein [Winogradskyella luteola]|uniref:Uncharacterized protein n=1 Tax=Winogradskyella luteola TaxID=2828330 RepID=A0A9X1JM04_9FLAO|nr:hypothetical protein [Winogradskyella luteola]MBV7267925.1 hypothetical protein [Winogradskyella luteola]
MKPNLAHLFVLLLTLILMACSSDDTNSNTDEANNEFVFNGITYHLVSAIITDENTATDDPSDIGISLFNKTSSEITGNNDLNDISYIYFDFNDVTIQNTTYTEIEDYDISINSSIVNSEFNHGTVLLSDNDPESDVYAQSASVTVTNFTEFNIVFTFTFTRNDGQVISGSYDGNYFMPDN